MARATGSINYLEHRTPLKDESGKYQIHPMFVKRDIVDREKMEKRVRDHCAMNVSSFISALETLEDETLYALADGNEVRVGDMPMLRGLSLFARAQRFIRLSCSSRAGSWQG